MKAAIIKLYCLVISCLYNNFKPFFGFNSDISVMENKDLPTLQELEWKDIRKEVKEANKELAGIIDNISPNKRYKLIKARYSFGDLILKEGIAQLPIKKGNLVPITDPSISSSLKNKLDYSPIPLFLTLKKATEVFINTGSRIIPLNLFNPGSLLGLFESIDFMFDRTSMYSTLIIHCLSIIRCFILLYWKVRLLTKALLLLC